MEEIVSCPNFADSFPSCKLCRLICSHCVRNDIGCRIEEKILTLCPKSVSCFLQVRFAPCCVKILCLNGGLLELSGFLKTAAFLRKTNVLSLHLVRRDFSVVLSTFCFELHEGSEVFERISN